MKTITSIVLLSSLIYNNMAGQMPCFSTKPLINRNMLAQANSIWKVPEPSLMAESESITRGAVSGANSPATNSNDQAWDYFWQTFRTAVQKRDRATLKTLMGSKLLFDTEESAPNTVFQLLSQAKRGGGSWADLSAIIAKGTAPYDAPTYKNAMVAPRAANSEQYHGWCAIFVRNRNGKWQWKEFISLSH